MVQSSKTLCPYCGVGCGLEVLPPAQPGKAIKRDALGNPLWQVRGDRSHPSSLGQVCVKGATVAESLDRNRLKTPLMRQSLDQPLEPVSWDTAFDRIIDEIQRAKASHGVDSLCMYGSGQFQTEDYYIAQKLMKGCLGTNNFDANSRLCMSSAVAGYIQSFGSDGPPCCYEDLELTDCAFLIGTNAAECHPIAFNRLHKHHRRNRQVKMVVVDPRRTKTAEAADLHLAITPGTDVTLLNGIAHLLMRWGELDSLFIDECTTGFTDYVAVIRQYPPELVARQCGIRLNDLEKAAQYWSQANNVLSLWSMGVNQSVQGTAKVCSIINLHLISGQVGRPGAGPFSLTGQPNAMGGREAGGLAHLLPGYRVVKNPEHRAEVEAAWGLPAGQIAAQPGRDAWSMITGLETGEVQFLWIAATNPAVSMPDLKRTQAALQRSPFTVYQDAYYPTETAHYAHLVLPAAQWGEKTGIMTNSERRVTLCSAFRPPVGQAKADWEIFAEVGRRLGFEAQFAFANSAEVFAEFVQLTRDRLCDMTGLSHDRLQAAPLHWPCPDSEPRVQAADRPEQRLYTDLVFATPDGLARFKPFHGQGLAEPVDPAYPFVLTVGRLYGHWHTQTRTGHIEKIRKLHPRPLLEIHPKDAKKLGIQNETWVEVRSRRGSTKFQAQVTKAISPGVLFAPMHWGALWAEDAEANVLTHSEACPISLEPELKACAVQVHPLSSLLAREIPTAQSQHDSLLPV
ncbi:MAG: molybdopterin oxidoreductase family protein [Prochlorothrix sp.]|nr:nitrate reductase [Prochlorothrix sp.]